MPFKEQARILGIFSNNNMLDLPIELEQETVDEKVVISAIFLAETLATIIVLK